MIRFMKQLKKNMTRLLVMAFPVVMMALFMVSCIEDGVTTSPSAQPQFSTDNAMGVAILTHRARKEEFG